MSTPHRRLSTPPHTPSASTLQAAAAVFGSAIINNDSRFKAPPAPPRGSTQ